MHNIHKFHLLLLKYAKFCILLKLKLGNKIVFDHHNLITMTGLNIKLIIVSTS